MEAIRERHILLYFGILLMHECLTLLLGGRGRVNLWRIGVFSCIMYGRGAYLYKQVERELAFQREQAKILRQFEAMRASIYQ